MKRALTVMTALLLALMPCPKSLADWSAETPASIVCPSPAPVEVEAPQPNAPQPTDAVSGDIGQEPEPGAAAHADTPFEGTAPTPAPENPQPPEPGTAPAPTPAPEPASASASVPLTATVNAPKFTIVIPDGIAFGTLNVGGTSSSVPLKVGVKDVSGVSGGSIVVTVHGDFTLTDEENKIPFCVLAPDGTALKSGDRFCGFRNLSDGASANKEGSMVIDLSAIVPGSFAGSLSFAFTFIPDLAQTEENESNFEQSNATEEVLMP